MNLNRLAFLSHPIILLTTLVGAGAVFVFAVMDSSSLRNALVGAIFGGAVGLVTSLFIYNLSYGRIERLLALYTQSLERVAQGDLTQRIVMPGSIPTSTREGAMASNLVAVTNRMLDRLQGIVNDFNSAMQRLDADTQAILEATARQIAMANEQDAVVTETTATVNEVRATVTETAERARASPKLPSFPSTSRARGRKPSSKPLMAWTSSGGAWRTLPITSWCSANTPSRSARSSPP